MPSKFGLVYICEMLISVAYISVHYFILFFLKVCIWDYFNNYKNQKLTNFSQTLEEAQLYMNHKVGMLLLCTFRDYHILVDIVQLFICNNEVIYGVE